MKCEKCGQNEASIYIERNINGQKQNIHLCGNCAELYQADIMNMTMNEVFQSFINGFKAGSAYGTGTKFEEKACSNCGLKYSQFIKGAKLGCAECYDTFGQELDNIYKNIQPGLKHSGKIPKKAKPQHMKGKEFSELKLSLKKAVEAEEYEKAAGIRDLIRSIEEKGGEA